MRLPDMSKATPSAPHLGVSHTLPDALIHCHARCLVKMQKKVIQVVFSSSQRVIVDRIHYSGSQHNELSIHIGASGRYTKILEVPPNAVEGVLFCF